MCFENEVLLSCWSTSSVLFIWEGVGGALISRAAMPCHARPFQAGKRASGKATRSLAAPRPRLVAVRGSRGVGMSSAGEKLSRLSPPADRPTTGGLSITGACVRVAAAPGCLLGGCALHGYAGKQATLPRWAGWGSAGACDSAHQQRLADNKNQQHKNGLLAWRSLLLCFLVAAGLSQLRLAPCWIPEAAVASLYVPQLAQRLSRSTAG